MTAHQMLLMGPTRADEIEADARRAWREHPDFVAEIVRLAREDRALNPAARLSIGELFVVATRNLRQVGVTVRPNHNWRRPFAAFVMKDYADLDGAFTLREPGSADEPPRGDA